MAKQENKSKKVGFVDYGRIYEQRIAAHLSIKSALDPEISDFWIAGNIDGLDKFDDIVLMTKNQAGTKDLYCIQLKHSEDSSSIQAKHLESKSSRFYLTKYQESFEIIEKNIVNNIPVLKGIDIDHVHLILWTNSRLIEHEKMKNATVESVGSLDFLNTSSKPNVYKIRNLDSSKTPYHAKFLERFYLFDLQASAVAMETIIKDELCSHFSDVSNAVIVNITDYFSKWSMGDKRTHKTITKDDVQKALLEYLLLPHFIEPVPGENKIENKMLRMMNDTLRSFNVIPLTEPKFIPNIFASTKFTLDTLCPIFTNLDISWTTDLSPTQWEALKTTEGDGLLVIRTILQDKKMFVPHLTLRDVYLTAWQCRLIPLVVDCVTSKNFIEKVLVEFKQVTKYLSLVLLDPICDTLEGHLKIFYSIDDLEHRELKDKNLNNTFFSLQGKKPISLKYFEDNPEVLQGVTPDAYLLLTQKVLQLGENVEVENYYVARDLRRPLIKLSVLDENSVLKDRSYMFNESGDLFILVEYDGSLSIRHENTHMGLQNYLTDKIYEKDEKIHILVTPLTITDELVTVSAVMLHGKTKKSVHIMKLKDKYLEWLSSNGTVETLQNHIVATNLMKDENPKYNIPENDILQSSYSHINIICNNAGMGKTFMLKSIANKFEPDEWVWYINLSEHISKIPQENSFVAYFNYLFHDLAKSPYLQKLGNRIYINCFLKKKIVCLFDGYDEVASPHAMQFLIEAKEHELRMWITTRPTYNRELEMRMGNLSVQITHFNTEDHVTFLWRYFNTYNYKYNFGYHKVQYIIDTINHYSSMLDKTLVSLPLQTRMFAEIFGNSIDEITSKGTLTTIDLYNLFVDVKLTEYKSYEVTSLRKTLSKLALKLFFTKEQLEGLLDLEDLADEAIAFQKSYKKDSIVIGVDTNGDAVFGHRTFAEFLAAYWLSKQIVNKKGEYNMAWLPLLEKLYHIEMVPVRVFFDKILSQKLPLHLAVINNDLDSVETFLKTTEDSHSLDVLGRSALHLAVTYGQYCDLYVGKEIKGLRNVGLHSVFRSGNLGYRLRIPFLEEKQYRISGEIVEELLNQNFPNCPDKLFGYDLFDYAMKSCSLNFVDILYKRFEKVTLYFDIGFYFEIFLFCIVTDNLYNILSKRKIYNFGEVQENRDDLREIFKGDNFKLLKMKYNDMYLTELAALKGAVEVMFVILESGALKIEDGNLVHKACFGGHIKMLEVLHRLGADMEKPDESNWSPLYQASQRGRSDLTYHLLSSSKFLSLSGISSTLMTPLHYAVIGGFTDCVNKLIEYGVRANVEDAYGFTPLLYACQYGHLEIIETLFQSGVLDISDGTVKTALNVTAFHGYADCIKKLLECGLDVNNVDNDGNTSLVIASKKGFSKVISELASSKKFDINLMVYNENRKSIQMWSAGNGCHILHTRLFLIKGDPSQHGGITALHFAVRHGHVDCVRTLIDLGADKQKNDEVTKYSSIVWACMYGHEKVLKILLEKKDENEDLVKTRNDAELGLLWASMVGYEKCVEEACKYILEFNQDLGANEEHEKQVKELIASEFGGFGNLWFIRDNENMPLILAAKSNCPTVIKTLTSIRYRDNYGLEEALHWAAKNGHLDCAKELKQAGADDTKKNEKSMRLLPIAWAALNRKADVVEYFLSDKTPEFLQNKDLYCALNWAAVGGQYDCVKLLLDFGLDVDNMDPELKGTPLINACQYAGTVEIVEELMKKNCKVNVENVEGKTALHFAAERKNFPFVKIFINCGAFNNLKVEKDGDLFKNLQVALKWAIEKGESELSEGLKALGITIEEQEGK